MRRSLILLNLILATAIGLAGWQMYRQYHSTRTAHRRYLSRPVVAPVPPILTLPVDAPPIQAATYYDIAAKLPFSPDRNPTVVVEVAAPKPMPALPAYHGMMNFGDGPRVILSSGTGSQRTYQIGQTIGEFKLVAVAQTGLVFEWDGKQVPAGYAELTKRAAAAAPQPQAVPATAASAAPATAPTAAPPVSTPAVKSVGAASSTTDPSSVAGDLIPEIQGNRECKDGDTTPDGTIVNGYRKQTVRSPFGVICRWVAVK